MIQIGKNGALTASPWQLDELTKEFSETHCVVLKDVFSAELLVPVNSKILESEYYKKADLREDGSVLAQEYSLAPTSLAHTFLYFLLNSKSFIDAVRTITGIPEIKSLDGRVYKFEAGADCYDSWHDDIPPAKKQTRILGFSLNLGTEPYEGGHFRLKTWENEQIIKDIHYSEWGTAHIFRIRKDLLHMVSSIEGVVPRVVYAGWFYATEPFMKNEQNSAL